MRNRRFEEWFAGCNGLTAAEVGAMYDGYNYTSYKYLVELAWAAWCAALGFELETKKRTML